MNALQFLISLHSVCHFQTREGKRVGRASNSELRRWLNDKVLWLNGESVKFDEPIDFPVFSVVLWPNNESKRTTLL